MIERIINAMFDKRKAESKREYITIVSEKNRERECAVIKNKKTVLWNYFSSMNGLNVRERGYAVSSSRTCKEFEQSLDFCR